MVTMESLKHPYLRAFYNPQWHFDIGLYMVSADKKTRAVNLVMERLPDDGGCVSNEPFATLEKESAQQLMDDLWRCGIRPTEGEGTAGSMRAVERHLADARAIAFAKLNSPVPK